METTCSRCHQTIPTDGLYCPSCGLPQFVYSGEESAVPAQANQSADAPHEVGAVEWKPALRLVLLLSVPVGLLLGRTNFLELLGLIWIAAVAAWAVTLYVRRQRAAQRPFWLTTGAGARIGLVTGLITGWVAFAAFAASLYVERNVFHRGKEMDDARQAQVAKGYELLQSSGLWQSLVASTRDPQAAEAMVKEQIAWSLSPEGTAGSALSEVLMAEFLLVAFAVAGGAMGAKLLAGPAKAGSRG
jgi:RNA polymerase subunit RPABC4/transcription elongation factor Spt4